MLGILLDSGITISDSSDSSFPCSSSVLELEVPPSLEFDPFGLEFESEMVPRFSPPSLIRPPSTGHITGLMGSGQLLS